MNGEYVRVTPGELARAFEDPVWALGLVEEIQDAEDEDWGYGPSHCLTADRLSVPVDDKGKGEEFTPRHS